MNPATSALICFLGMWACVAAAVALLRNRIIAYRKVGIGGDNENLDLARRYAREGFYALLAMVAALTAAIMLGEFWSPNWREAHATWPLGAVSVVAGGCSLAAFAYSVRQQWSRSGSYFGMLKGGFAFAAMVSLLMLSLRWRFGL